MEYPSPRVNRNTVQKGDESLDGCQTTDEKQLTANQELQRSQEALQSVNTELLQTNDDLLNLIDSTAIPTLIIDTELRVRHFTPSTHTLFKFEDVLGEPVGALAGPLDYVQLEDDVRQTLTELAVVEREVRSKDAQATYLMRARPYRSSVGTVGGAVLTFIDITDRKRRDVAQAHLAAIIDSSQDAVFGQDIDGRINSWNPGSERLTGYSAEEAIGQTIALILSPDHAAEATDIFGRTRRGENVSNYPSVCQRKDGGLVPIAVTASPIVTSDGEIAGVSVIAQNISARVEAERQRDILMAELDHRVKNTLVAVQSIALQTAQGTESIDDFLSRFDARLMALSRTHNLLLERHWTGASLRDLVLLELLPYGGEHPRYSITGPDIQVSPKQALALGLGFHELATNAAKHGAFATPSGNVEVKWGVDDTGGRGTLWLAWQEHGGPPVEPPTQRGFGSRLIERGLRSELQAEVTLTFDPQGVRFELRAPIEELP